MNSELLFEKRLYDKACLTNTPISGTFELLPTCNLACKMCYIKLDGNMVKNKGGLRHYKDWINIAKKAKKAGLLFLLLTGGETLMYPHFKELYIELSKMGFILEINSNGTLIDEGFVSWIKDIPPRHIKISLYGASKETYKALCGDADAFNKVINSFQLLTDNNIPVFISITVTPLNIHELDQMVEICNRYNFKFKITSYMYPPVRSCNGTLPLNYRLSSYEAAKVTARIIEIEYGKEVFNERCKEIANGKYTEMYSSLDNNQECMHCRAGSCTFWITWQGYMTPCAMLDTISIPVIDCDFNVAWKKLGQEIKKIRLPLECSNCKAAEMCYSCAASAYCETGEYEKKPEYVCQMTKHYIEFMTENYKKIEE